MFILELFECAPSSGVCCVHWFVVDTKFPPSGCHFGSSQIFGPCFGCNVGVEEEIEVQLGDFGCLSSHHHPRFGVLLAPQDEVCRLCAAAAASFGVAGGDFAEVVVEVSVAGSQLCGG